MCQTANTYEYLNTKTCECEITDKIKSHSPYPYELQSPNPPRLVLGGGMGEGSPHPPKETLADAVPAANPVIPGL